MCMLVNMRHYFVLLRSFRALYFLLCLRSYNTCIGTLVLFAIVTSCAQTLLGRVSDDLTDFLCAFCLVRAKAKLNVSVS